MRLSVYLHAFFKRTILQEQRASIVGHNCRLSRKRMDKFQKCVLQIVAGSFVIVFNRKTITLPPQQGHN